MNNKYTYEIGKVYGVKRLDRLEVCNGHTTAVVSCVLCGKVSKVRPSSLFTEKNTSCMCKTRSVLGDSSGRLYATYHNMKYRCYTETAHEYENYGGRGITVCDEWLGENGYMTFKAWALENGYNDTLTIDRINSDEGYSPSNCQWISKAENTARANSSKRTQHRKTVRGSYYAISPCGERTVFENANQFAKEHNLSANAVRKSARSGKQACGWQFGYIEDLTDRTSIDYRKPE